MSYPPVLILIIESGGGEGRGVLILIIESGGGGGRGGERAGCGGGRRNFLSYGQIVS